MPKRKPKTELQSAFDAIAGFRDLVAETLEKITGKSPAAWLEEFAQRPEELPPGPGGTASSDTMSLVNAYVVFGLPVTATRAEVKRNYRNLAKAFHSDTGRTNDEAMKLINRAYERIEKEKKAK